MMGDKENNGRQGEKFSQNIETDSSDFESTSNDELSSEFESTSARTSKKTKRILTSVSKNKEAPSTIKAEKFSFKNIETDSSDFENTSNDELSSEFEGTSASSSKKTKRIFTSVSKNEEDLQQTITCKFCNCKFSSWSTVSRHRKTCSKNPDRLKSLLKCSSCGRDFVRQYIFRKHIKGCTGKPQNSERKRTKCPMSDCQTTFLFKKDLHNHLLNFHKKKLEKPRSLSFPSFDEFGKWKTHMEDETFSYYSQQYGKRGGNVYYYCQHDGQIKTHRKSGEPARKTTRTFSKGCIKANKLCLSMIVASCQDDGKVKVLFYPSHSHKCRPRDLKFQPLSAESNDFINKQLAWSVPPRKIVHNLRGDTFKRENRWKKRPLRRENLVNVKRITERKRAKLGKIRCSSDDANSVFLKVQCLSEETFNPILIYKPQGEKLVMGPEGSEKLPDDVFMLGFQTYDQQEMMMKHSKTILAMDETHGTNECGFKLLNLVVKDDFNLGYPVGHLITSRSDEATLQYFYKAIKERCPEVSVNCCITDDDPALINALQSGFGETIWHILCIWHIHRTLQCKLRELVKDLKLQDEMYQVLCVIIDAPTVNEFQKLVDCFLKEFGSVSPGFKKYFEGTFLPKAKKWAMCFRQEPHGNVDTTMIVESFHNILKTVYLRRIPNRRIDDLLDILLQMEEDYFARYSNAVETETLCIRDVNKIKERHQRGSSIKDEDFVKVSPKFFKVKSQEKDESKEYSVVRCAAGLCQGTLCIFICQKCKVCSHMYTCSCPDPTPLCKHIHKVHLMEGKALASTPVKDEEPQFYIAENLNFALETFTNSDPFEKKVEVVKDKLKELEAKLDDSPVKKFMLSRIQGVLDELNHQCNAVSDGSMQDVPSMNKNIKICPNEKLKTQQLKPFKKVKRGKKKNSLQVPNRKSAAEIKQFLFQEDDENEEEIDDIVDCNDNLVDTVVVIDDTAVESEQDQDVSEWNQIVKEYEKYKLTVLHLKTLENKLSLNESEVLKREYKNFSPGWLYSEVIDVFFRILQSNNETLYSCDSTVALGLHGGSKYKGLISTVSSKEMVLFPSNIEGNHWCVSAICVKTSEIWYYNPLAHPGSTLSKGEMRLLTVIGAFARDAYSSTKKWTVKRHFDMQADTSSCGIFVCWFAYQLSDLGGAPIPLLSDPIACHQEIYDALMALP